MPTTHYGLSPNATSWTLYCNAGATSAQAPPKVGPTDYRYNRINRDAGSLRFPVFEQVAPCEFRYLSPDFSYTGDISGSQKANRQDPERRLRDPIFQPELVIPLTRVA